LRPYFATDCIQEFEVSFTVNQAGGVKRNGGG